MQRHFREFSLKSTKIYKNSAVFTLLVLVVVFTPLPAFAYIGPGAGFALLSSLMALMLSFFMAFITLLTLPIRILYRFLVGRKAYSNAKIKKLVILGLDGLDPDLCDKFMDEDLMPNLARLKKTASYQKLASTFPSLSPVAWSTFSTGTNPGKHNIYDFLTRNPETYFPELSSTRIATPKKTLSFGSYKIPLGKPIVKFMRKSKSFWTILGNYGIYSSIIRVPITYPPEKFYGSVLSAMCTPDLKGTQGSFSYYSNNPQPSSKFTGGTRIQLEQSNGYFTGFLEGPDNPLKPDSGAVKLLFKFNIDKVNQVCKIQIAKKVYNLKVKEFSPWIKVTFKAGLGVKINGICQFYLKNVDPYVELYVSPINIDPEKPALPISYPYYFSVYLAKLFGSYSTLGLAEDTWALNEEILDEESFLKQAFQLFEEREKQYFHGLSKTNKGLCACVFDGTDRIQHMFFRYLVKDHPANSNKDESLYKDTIAFVYQKADEIIGKTLDHISGEKDTLFFVLSDHGFKSFIRGINLNSWLAKQGYLKLKNGDLSQEYLQNVDWSQTKAYAIGLAGIYLNVRGREKYGIVGKGNEENEIKADIIKKLSGLLDPDLDKIAINQVYDSNSIYNGAYVSEAPDLIVGYNDGYRISWEAAIGKTTEDIFKDNNKNWSGDHAVDPRIVPGIIASNYSIKSDNLHIADIAPTVLKQFGVTIPGYMDGKPWEITCPN